MKIISRKNNRAYKNSIHNKDLLLTNFLPIYDISLFDECKQYIENLKVKDITSKIAESNGTLTLLNEKNGFIYSLYTNYVGYVRIKNIYRKQYQILNTSLSDEDENIIEVIDHIDSIDTQLHLIIKHIIFNN